MNPKTLIDLIVKYGDLRETIGMKAVADETFIRKTKKKLFYDLQEEATRTITDLSLIVNELGKETQNEGQKSPRTDETFHPKKPYPGVDHC